MTLDNSIYPRISLPYGLRIQFILNRVMRFGAFAADEDNSSSISLEREFNALISRENATIARICLSYSGSVAEFDDLRQDALINIWRGIGNFRDEASEKTWIYRVTVNSCLSTIRKQSRHQHESLEGLYDMIEGDDSWREAIERMHRVIRMLDSQERAIIMMWLDELSYEDIAAAMGLNRNTVATKVRRIKDKIRSHYKKHLL